MTTPALGLEIDEVAEGQEASGAGTEGQRSARKANTVPTPSFSLKECFENTRQLYEIYADSAFSKTEIASTLGLSATSSSFGSRLFSLREYGLISPVGQEYRVTEAFHNLNGNSLASPVFKQTALDAIKRSDVFRDLLVQFSTKLPPRESIAKRLIGQKKFSEERARLTAGIIESSLRFAGVLDSANNILPIREAHRSSSPRDIDESNNSVDEREDETRERPKAKSPEIENLQGLLRLDIALGSGRKAIVFYPDDITENEAVKVGAVLSAVAA